MKPQTIENYLVQFVKNSQSPDCDNMKAYDATRLRQHLLNAQEITDRVQADEGDGRKAWLSQRYKARELMTDHFGLRSSFVKPTITGSILAIHNPGSAILNIPGELE